MTRKVPKVQNTKIIRKRRSRTKATLFHSSFSLLSALSFSTCAVIFLTSFKSSFNTSFCLEMCAVEKEGEPCSDVHADRLSSLDSRLSDMPLHGLANRCLIICGEFCKWPCTILNSSCCSHVRKSCANFSPITFVFRTPGGFRFLIMSSLASVPRTCFLIHGGTGRRSGPMWCILSTPTDIASDIEIRTMVLAKYWPVWKTNNSIRLLFLYINAEVNQLF